MTNAGLAPCKPEQATAKLNKMDEIMKAPWGAAEAKKQS
jgi:hypothetical protein